MKDLLGFLAGGTAVAAASVPAFGVKTTAALFLPLAAFEVARQRIQS